MYETNTWHTTKRRYQCRKLHGRLQSRTINQEKCVEETEREKLLEESWRRWEEYIKLILKK
jgi:hypothetical protein